MGLKSILKFMAIFVNAQFVYITYFLNSVYISHKDMGGSQKHCLVTSDSAAAAFMTYGWSRYV